MVSGLEQGLTELHERDGVVGLDALPGIGPRIAAAIVEMLRTGRWSQVERLRGSLDAGRLFRAIPGVGPALARRIHEPLHVDTLEALEVAAHDGRLAAVPGLGPRRAAIAAMLSPSNGIIRRRRHETEGSGRRDPEYPHDRAGQWFGDQRGDHRREQREVVPRPGARPDGGCMRRRAAPLARGERPNDAYR
jgi:hypothetical protein